MPHSTRTSPLAVSGFVVLVVFIAIVADSTVGFDQDAAVRDAPPARQVARQRSDPADHRESPGDPPARRPSRDVTGAVVSRSTWTRGPYQSVQVNVDAFGNNISGDAANEPSIAVDPNDGSRIAIGWRQFDSVLSDFRQAGWGYSQDGGETWTFPGVLQPGVFRSDPVLDFDADGLFYYYSLTAGFTCQLFRSVDGGMNWGPAISAFGGDKAWMAIDRTDGIGRGNIYCVWSFAAGCCGNRVFTRSTNGGFGFMEPITVPGFPFWGTNHVGPDGALYITGAAFGFAPVVRSTNAQDPSAVPVFDLVASVDLGGNSISGTGPNPGGLLGQVYVATDHSTGPTAGNVYLTASVDPPGSDPLDVMFSRSTDGGVTWSPPVRINDDPPGNNAWQWFATLSVAPNGRIDVVWNDTRADPTVTFSELYHSSSIDGGVTWAANVPLSPPFNHFLGYPNQDKLGDYYHMVSDEFGASLAYAATFNGEQDVYFLRISNSDCNENEIVDLDDIAAGTSDDCNSNSIPDECEADCNSNGSPDECDVDGATSFDCNANRIPDECESDADCNENSIADICDVFAGTSRDCNENDIPDECESLADCNENGVQDICDIFGDTSDDCNVNLVPDECDIDGDTSEDCQPNEVPDECDLVMAAHDCCETDHGPGCSDPDIAECVCTLDSFCCEVDWGSFCADLVELVACGACVSSFDCNFNGVPDECEIDALIVTDPEDRQDCPGDTAVLSISAPDADGFQWYRDGIPLFDGGTLSGAMTDTLTIDGVAAQDDGSYVCRVFDGCLVAASEPAYLTVVVAAAITGQPESASTICEGHTAFFGIVADGTALTYEWRIDGVPLVNDGRISGADSATLEIAEASFADEGAYTCFVADPCGGSDESEAGVLELASPVFVLDPEDACAELGATAVFTAEATSTPSQLVGYRWKKDGALLTDGGDISGVATDTLTIGNVSANDAGEYGVVAFSFDPVCFTDSTLATLTVGDCCTSTAACPWADVNCDDMTDAFDIAVIRDGTNWFKPADEAAQPRADVNGDGVVDGFDIAAVRNGSCWLR